MRRRLRGLALAALALAASGALARDIKVQQVGNLRFVNIPEEPLKPSWSRVGLTAASFDPNVVLGQLQSVGGLGSRILAASRSSGFRTILVAYVHSRMIPREVRAEMKKLGFQQRKVEFRHSTLASWQAAGNVGLITVRVDRIVSKRRQGFAVSPAGSVAHELVHVGQSAWGALDRGRTSESYYDALDEAEAWMVTDLVERAGLGTRPFLNAGETQLMRTAPVLSRRALESIAAKLVTRPYRSLETLRKDDPARYRPENDPFRQLPP